MTPKQMIEVLEAYERGEKIEVRSAFYDDPWDETFSPLWDFNAYDYRIAKPAPKRVKFLAYVDSGGYIFYKRENLVVDLCKRIPSLDLEGEVE